MDWRLRRATTADAAACSLVATASFLETFAGILAGTDIVQHCAVANAPGRFTGWAADPGSVVTIAEHPHGGAPIGYSVLTTPDLPLPTAPDDIELKRIYTLSIARSTGLGASLMKQAIADAGGLGRRRILLGVYGGNRRAHLFYERQGFVRSGERQFQVGETWHNDFIYSRMV